MGGDKCRIILAIFFYRLIFATGKPNGQNCKIVCPIGDSGRIHQQLFQKRGQTLFKKE